MSLKEVFEDVGPNEVVLGAGLATAGLVLSGGVGVAAVIAGGVGVVAADSLVAGTSFDLEA